MANCEKSSPGAAQLDVGGGPHDESEGSAEVELPDSWLDYDIQGRLRIGGSKETASIACLSGIRDVLASASDATAQSGRASEKLERTRSHAATELSRILRLVADDEPANPSCAVDPHYRKAHNGPVSTLRATVRSQLVSASIGDSYVCDWGTFESPLARIRLEHIREVAEMEGAEDFATGVCDWHVSADEFVFVHTRQVRSSLQLPVEAGDGCTISLSETHALRKLKLTDTMLSHPVWIAGARNLRLHAVAIAPNGQAIARIGQVSQTTESFSLRRANERRAGQIQHEVSQAQYLTDLCREYGIDRKRLELLIERAPCGAANIVVPKWEAARICVEYQSSDEVVSSIDLPESGDYQHVVLAPDVSHAVAVGSQALCRWDLACRDSQRTANVAAFGSLNDQEGHPIGIWLHEPACVEWLSSDGTWHQRDVETLETGPRQKLSQSEASAYWRSDDKNWLAIGDCAGQISLWHRQANRWVCVMSRSVCEPPITAIVCDLSASWIAVGTQTGDIIWQSLQT